MEKENNLKNYFIEEIMRVSDCEVASLDQELSEIKSERVKMIQEKIKQESIKQQAYLTNEMLVEHKKRISKVKDESKLAMYQYRDCLVQQLFDEFKQQVIQYQKSEAYTNKLKNLLKAYHEIGYENYVCEISHLDNKNLFEGYNFKQVVVSNQIQMGGFILMNEEDGMMIDESLDSKYQDAIKSFYETSNFTL